MLDGEEPFDSFGLDGRTAETPNGVGRVEEGGSQGELMSNLSNIEHHFFRVLILQKYEVFFNCVNNLKKNCIFAF